VCSVQVVVKHRSELMKTNFAQIALTVDRREERSGRDYGVYTPAPSRSLALSLSRSMCPRHTDARHVFVVVGEHRYYVVFLPRDPKPTKLVW